MRKILFIFLFSGIFTSVSFIQISAQMKKAIYLGISLDDFRKIYPEIVPAETADYLTLKREDNIYGLSGKWVYSFKKNKLDWYKFEVYINEINQDNFNKCLIATQKIIEDYRSIYGEPIKYKEGKTEFIDPFKQMHHGYKVLSAVWKSGGEAFEVQFKFYGSKGEYYFIVSIDFQDAEFAYF